jgi:toxin ParE1/3/4
VSYRVVFSPEAHADIIDLYDYITVRSNAMIALGYLERLERSCLSLATFSNRGTRRDDVRRGLRVMGFARRVTVGFAVTADIVTILRVLYGGRDIRLAFSVSQGSC